jgi:putative sigma-54 modulation protein
MKVIYKGVHHDLPEKLQAKLDVKFGKLSKMLEQRGEKEAHVIVTNERRMHKAEITLQFYDHQLIGAGSDSDLFKAMSAALTKIEKQALKQRTKWRESRRGDKTVNNVSVAPKGPEVAAERKSSPRVYRVNHYERRKPMTIEEAMIQMEGREGYFAYRDADKDGLSVLIRRKDGNFDLIEA